MSSTRSRSRRAALLAAAVVGCTTFVRVEAGAIDSPDAASDASQPTTAPMPTADAVLAPAAQPIAATEPAAQATSKPAGTEPSVVTGTATPTQPAAADASAPASVSPTPMPVPAAAADVATAPATQPAAGDLVPPATAADAIAATLPATQPMPMPAVASTDQPTTEAAPVAAIAVPATEPAVAEMPATEPAAAETPATMPAAAPVVTVTPTAPTTQPALPPVALVNPSPATPVKPASPSAPPDDRNFFERLLTERRDGQTIWFPRTRRLIAGAANFRLNDVVVQVQPARYYPTDLQPPPHTDPAMRYRHWTPSMAVIPGGATRAGDTRFALEPAADDRLVTRALLEPGLFLVNTILFPVTYLISPPFTERTYRGELVTPSYTLNPPLPGALDENGQPTDRPTGNNQNPLSPLDVETPVRSSDSLVPRSSAEVPLPSGQYPNTPGNTNRTQPYAPAGSPNGGGNTSISPGSGVIHNGGPGAAGGGSGSEAAPGTGGH